jgi:predicted MFS family arabinose efflux permease
MAGLFNTATYAGFTFLAAFAGLVAGEFSFLTAFLLLAGMAAVMAFTISGCQCEYRG